MTTAAKSDEPSPETPDLWCGYEIPVIGITGAKNSGKTLFASSIMPEETLMIDCELSSATYAGIPYKRRVDLFAELAKNGKHSPSPLDAFLQWKNLLDRVKDGDYRVIVTDPWDFVQHGLYDWIRANPKMFNKSDAQYAKSSGLLWGDLKNWLHMYLSMLATRCRGTVVLINHEGTVWEGGKPVPGKVKTRGVDTVYQLASLYLNFDRKPDQSGKIPAIPAAYTCPSHRGKSRLAHTHMEDGKLLIEPILPPRIPECTPDAIRQYINKPCNIKSLKQKERIEVEVVTEDDRLALKAQQAADERAAEEAKLSRLELMQAAAARSAQANDEHRPAEKGSSADMPVSADEPPVQEGTDHEGLQDEGAETEPQESQQDDAVANESPGESESPSSAEDPQKSIYDILQEQRNTLSEGADPITSLEWKKILGKRLHPRTKEPCVEFTDLSEQQAEELSAKLWDLIEKRNLGE